jgi:hypothetical protein
MANFPRKIKHQTVDVSEEYESNPNPGKCFTPTDSYTLSLTVSESSTHFHLPQQNSTPRGTIPITRIMMRHRSPNRNSTVKLDDLEGQCAGRNDHDQKGMMTFRNKFHLSLRSSVLVISGLFAVLYSVEFFLQDHARFASTTTLTSTLQYSPSFHVGDSPTKTTSSSLVSSHAEHDTTIKECGIWMAPSSLRPNPGFGIFTTRNIAHHESILHQPDAVSIALHDMRRRNDMPLAEERRNLWMNVIGSVSNKNTDVAGHSNKWHPVTR